MTIFLNKKFYNSLYIGPIFFLNQFKNRIILIFFVIFVATKKGRAKILLSALFFVAYLDPGSETGIRDRQKIRIRVPG
jgi:hypothetical protein